MKIKELIVRKTKPSEEIIREIIFNEKGLSLIIDDTPKDMRESGNSVGKSTAIKIIDLCLGAKSTRELYYDSDTRSENIEIKTFLSEYKVQAELVLINKDKKEYIIKRDLFPRGKKYIFDKTYNENDFWNELKKIIFDLNEDKPTFRQLIPKFIRLDNTAEDRIIKFLPMMTSNDTYDLVYCFLFQIYGEVLLNKRSEINDKILECQKTIQALEKSKSIVSLSVLKQSLELVNEDLNVMNEKRQKLSYMDAYRDELDAKRKLTIRINELQENMQFLEFEIKNIEESISKLSQEKKDIDFTTLQAIYEEAKSYVPDIQRSFEDMVAFHNSMIQNRIDFIRSQLVTKQELLEQYSQQLNGIDDEGQTVLITERKISIHTTATDKNGKKEMEAGKDLTIVDTVTLDGLEIGTKYKLSGWQMIKEENAKLIIDGKEVTNDYEFTADKGNMEVQIEFIFDGSTLGGKQLVTFEELYDMTNPEEPKKVTEHKDINDEGQTVTIKEVPETPTPETPGTTTKTSNHPKTGDTANAALWIAILVLSAAGITGVRIWNKKKQVKRLGIEEKKEEEE